MSDMLSTGAAIFSPSSTNNREKKDKPKIKMIDLKFIELHPDNSYFYISKYIINFFHTIIFGN